MFLDEVRTMKFAGWRRMNIRPYISLRGAMIKGARAKDKRNIVRVRAKIVGLVNE